MKNEQINQEKSLNEELSINSVSTENNLKKINSKYHFENGIYTKNQWYRKIANYLRIEKDTVSLRKTPKTLRINEIEGAVRANVKKSTFFRLILPCIVFLLLSLVLLWVGILFQTERNLLSLSQKHFLTFLGALFLVFSLVFGVKIFILKQKVIMFGTNKIIKYKFLSKKQYEAILNEFEK